MEITESKRISKINLMHTHHTNSTTTKRAGREAHARGNGREISKFIYPIGDL